MTLSDHNTSHPVLYPISVNISIPLLEIIYSPEIMPIFEFIWIIRQIINVGVVYEIFERLYEKYKVWRKICFYKRKILKAIMTSWDTLCFVNFEMAWKILKKSKIKSLYENKVVRSN